MGRCPNSDYLKNLNQAVHSHDAKSRQIGVPTIADRVAQTVVKQLLEPVIDPIFHANSYGYRPERSAHGAIAMVRRRNWEHDWLVELDIKGLFGVGLLGLTPGASQL